MPSFQEERLLKLTFAANLERSEIFVPRAVRRLRLRFAPQFQLVKVSRRYLPLRDPIEQVLPENRWKIGHRIFGINHQMSSAKVLLSSAAVRQRLEIP